jgi:hypothetical protein
MAKYITKMEHLDTIAEQVTALVLHKLRLIKRAESLIWELHKEETDSRKDGFSDYASLKELKREVLAIVMEEFEDANNSPLDQLVTKVRTQVYDALKGAINSTELSALPKMTDSEKNRCKTCGGRIKRGKIRMRVRGRGARN